LEERRAALLRSLQEAEGERDGFLTIEEVTAELRAAIDEVAPDQS
jgi:hypothetical protein